MDVRKYQHTPRDQLLIVVIRGEQMFERAPAFKPCAIFGLWAIDTLRKVAPSGEF
jgi:hypothetical protein